MLALIGRPQMLYERRNVVSAFSIFGKNKDLMELFRETFWARFI